MKAWGRNINKMFTDFEIKQDPKKCKKAMKKFKKQRIKRGFADSDLWNFDSYIIDLFIDMLKRFQEIAHGWPQSEEFPEFEDWMMYIQNIIDEFTASQMEQDLVDSDLEHWKEHYEAQVEHEKKGFELLQKHLHGIWD